ncbi:SH3 domain containing protein [Elaphomyces granulatus]
MAAQSDFSAAMTNRSLRTIRTVGHPRKPLIPTLPRELEFLTDAAVITPQQLSSILSQLPSQVQLNAPISPSQPAQSQDITPYNPPTNQLASVSLGEKASLHSPYSSPAPPPAYAQAPPVLSIASALYAYTPTDAGDLALQPQDRIQVLEHMNNDWWRGRNERTHLEGIFPRSYVTISDEKPALSIVSPQPISYSNLPLEVSQTGSSPGGRKPSKLEEQGKKFGKKMGNAAIFGAGATIGSNIVNGIF